jgi:HEAT repeat protein
MTIAQTLSALAEPEHKITMTALRTLSDLPWEQRDAFWEPWQELATLRRREVVGRLVELADDNVDLNFSTVLLACLQDGDSAVRARAAEGLWENEHPRSMRQLLSLMLGDPAPEVRAAAAVTLSRFAYMAEMGELSASDDGALREAFMRVLNDAEQPPVVRRRALESAGYFGAAPEVERAIREAYGAGETGLRESALVAMGRSLQPGWLATIGENLGSDNAALRYQAARAAGEYAEDGEPLLRGLLPLLDDDDGEVSLAAIWALGQIGGQRAKDALERMRKRGDEAQRQAADAALTELSLGDELADL